MVSEVKDFEHTSGDDYPYNDIISVVRTRERLSALVAYFRRLMCQASVQHCQERNGFGLI